MDQVEAVPTDKPLWQKIVDYPLVAMVIAGALYVLVISIAGAAAIVGIPPIAGVSDEMKIYALSIILLIPLYWFVIAKLGDPKRNDLKDPKWAKHLLLGLVGGTFIFSVAVAIAGAFGVYKIIGFGTFKGLLAAIIVPTLGAAVTEEMFFRGILFRWIEQFGGSWLALLVTSVLFGAAHLTNPHSSWIAAAGIALEAGVMLGAAYMLTRSLWFPMGLHAAWNFTQGEVYDIPVSGTKVEGMLDAKLVGDPLLTGFGFGLEASIIAIVIATIFGLWLLSRAIREGQLISPSWSRAKEG
jgi:hypothetical protein